ncbi:MAG: hypothetical protein ACM3ML_00105 [Micromonosporaceae bacterium]
MVIAEYWLACYLGRAWLWLQPSLRPAMEDLPDLCQRVAKGEQLPAGQLWEAQDFAVKVWWRAGLAVVLLIFPVIGLTAVLHPGHTGRNVGADVIAVLVCLGGVAAAQMTLLRFRANRTRDQMARTELTESVHSLPQGALGLPRRSDFWVMLTIAIALFAALFYAGSHSTH